MTLELNKYDKIQLCFKTVYPIAIALKFIYSRSFYRMCWQLSISAVISSVHAARSIVHLGLDKGKLLPPMNCVVLS